MSRLLSLGILLFGVLLGLGSAVPVDKASDASRFRATGQPRTVIEQKRVSHVEYHPDTNLKTDKPASVDETETTIKAPSFSYEEAMKGRTGDFSKEFHNGLIGQRMADFATKYGIPHPYTQPAGVVMPIGSEKRRVWAWAVTDIPTVVENDVNIIYPTNGTASTLIRFSFAADNTVDHGHLRIDVMGSGKDSSSNQTCLSAYVRVHEGKKATGLIVKLRGSLRPKYCPFEESALLSLYEKLVLRCLGATVSLAVDRTTYSFPFSKHRMYLSFVQQFVPALAQHDVFHKMQYQPRFWDNCTDAQFEDAQDMLKCTTVEYISEFLDSMEAANYTALRESIVNTFPISPASVGLTDTAPVDSHVLGDPQCQGHVPLSWVIQSWLEDMKAISGTQYDMTGSDQVAAIRIIARKIHSIYKVLQIVQYPNGSPYDTLTDETACAHRVKHANWFV